MRRVILILVSIIVLGAAGIVGYRRVLAPSPPTPTPQLISATQTSLAKVVSAEAFVVPARKAELAFRASGQVTEVLVKEGDRVQAGQPLAQLDDTHAQTAVAQAQASMAQAQASVTQAAAGIIQAQAAVQQARAALKTAEAGVASARAQRDKVKAGPTQQAIAQAEAAVNTARARLRQVTAGARPEDIDASAAALLKAEAAVRRAQTEYDKVAWADNKGETPQALALQQATLDYEAVKAQHNRLLNGARPEDVEVARAALAEAQAALEVIKAGPTAEDIAIAEAAVTQAEGRLSEARAALDAAQANLATAQANLQAAQANLSAARTAYQAARKNLSDYRLTAPFSGVVSRVRIEVGEIATVGAPVISLGDDSVWYVDTDDLSEVDVVKVAVGQAAKVSVDALPGQEFRGIVTDITPRSETKRGDVTYTVSIRLPKTDNAPLRWGMTAFVDIQVEEQLTRR